jgi:hypothetical protein
MGAVEPNVTDLSSTRALNHPLTLQQVAHGQFLASDEPLYRKVFLRRT